MDSTTSKKTTAKRKLDFSELEKELELKEKKQKERKACSLGEIFIKLEKELENIKVELINIEYKKDDSLKIKNLDEFEKLENQFELLKIKEEKYIKKINELKLEQYPVFECLSSIKKK